VMTDCELVVSMSCGFLFVDTHASRSRMPTFAAADKPFAARP
jgi:hypothetical protein